MDIAKLPRLSLGCLAVALGGCLLRAAPVHAGAAPEPAAAIVRYHDLDLSTVTGAQTLYRRISAAARSVCGAEGVRPLAELQQWQNCYDSAVARAIAAVDSPLLSRLAPPAHRPPANGTAHSVDHAPAL
jgi:UrcA family protein